MWDWDLVRWDLQSRTGVCIAVAPLRMFQLTSKAGLGASLIPWGLYWRGLGQLYVLGLQVFS